MPRARTHSYMYTHTRACGCDRIGFSVVFKVLVYFAPGHGPGVTILFRRNSYSINKLDVLDLPRHFLVKVAEHLLAQGMYVVRVFYCSKLGGASDTLSTCQLLHFALAVNQQYLCTFAHDLVGEMELVHQLDEMLPADKTRAVRVVEEQ